MIRPAASAVEHVLAGGVVALPGGFAFLSEARALLCADAHLGYEDVMGAGRAALPLWSTHEIVARIAVAAQRAGAREIVFLGDALHGAGLSPGAARAVRDALDGLRTIAHVTFVAGNHEGKSRGVAVLGATVEACERDGWTLVHGDRPTLGIPTIVGHLHPSLHLGGDTTAPAFLAARGLVVVPALTPYSPGLDVLSDECARAIGLWGLTRADVHVVATTDERVYPFGTLAALRGAVRTPGPRLPNARFRRRLRPDAEA